MTRDPHVGSVLAQICARWLICKAFLVVLVVVAISPSAPSAPSTRMCLAGIVLQFRLDGTVLRQDPLDGCVQQECGRAGGGVGCEGVLTKQCCNRTVVGNARAAKRSEPQELLDHGPVVVDEHGRHVPAQGARWHLNCRLQEHALDGEP